LNATCKVVAFGKSDIGQRRSNNQDSFVISLPLQLFAVADGMGGHSGGEVASAMAVKTLEKIFEEKKFLKIKERMIQACTLANKTIFDQARNIPELAGMGTTLTAAAIDWPWLIIGQVGDSRCYLYRDSNLFQITEDHSQYYELLRAGLVDEIESLGVQKNVITRSVGYEESVTVDIYSRLLQRGDRYLICSDGLSGMVSNEQIAQILQNFDLFEAVQKLIELANFQGGEDNVTVILLEIE
jgi:serine/threonine protein phosphatase PrpC